MRIEHSEAGKLEIMTRFVPVALSPKKTGKYISPPALLKYLLKSTYVTISLLLS